MLRSGDNKLARLGASVDSDGMLQFETTEECSALTS